ncbi:MAG: hypothetical protein K0R15_955 [Clostridiales bacterium]|jgi:hypothetical protein|nr:hypothetical protein [Clostridiales bacterium]
MNKAKVIILCILVTSSLILTANVWFDGISSMWVFNTKTKDSYTELIDREITFVTPSKLTIFDNVNKEFYLIKRTRAEFDELNFTTRKLMQQVFLNGKYELIEGINWTKLWETNAINLDLGIKVQLDEWIEDLHVKKKKNDYSNFEFDTVVIQMHDSSCSAYLINEEENKTLEIIANDKTTAQLNQTVLQRVISLSEKGNLEIVESTKYSGIMEFSNNIFFQKEKSGVISNPVFEIYTPFIEAETQVNLSDVEAFVNPFFPNSASKYMVEGDNSKILTYRDERLIVKYNLEQGIIEYSDISVGKGAALNLSSAYKSAISFMEKDLLVANQEIHLSNYKVVDNEAYFYFEYTYDDYDIVIPYATKSDLGISAPIEVVVSNGKVSFYKRLIFNYNITMGTFESVNLDYQYVLDSIKKDSVKIKPISDAYIAYIYYSDRKECEISWVAENDQRFLIPIK